MDSSKVSVKLRHSAKDLGTEVSNLVMADLISIGYTEADAYTIAYPERVSVYSLQQVQSLRDGIINSDAFKDLLEKRRESRMETRGRKPKVFNNSDVELLDHTDVAKELLTCAMNMPAGSKERGDLLVKYSELLRKNTQTIEDEEDPVRIYIPLSCSRCQLYQDYLETKQNSNNGE